MSYAEVAVNFPTLRHKTFTYSVPPGMSVEVGQAVWVPFGARRLQGVVFELPACPAVEDTKDIAELIDPFPILSPAQVELARWIGEHYLASFFDAAALMMPPGFERKTLTFVYLLPNPSRVTIGSLTSSQKEVLNYLTAKGRATLEEVEKVVGGSKARQVIDQLQRKGLVGKSLELAKPKVRAKVVRNLRLAAGRETALESVRLLENKAPKQAALLKLLVLEPDPIPISEAVHRVGGTTALIEALERKGMIRIDEVRMQRDPLAHRAFRRATPPVLSAAQEAVWREIKACLGESRCPGHPPSVFLLHGVTGSGKTEIYLRALAECVAKGERGIVLVPEISLTPQTVDRFAARFPNRVAVLHSKLALGEQFDQWHLIREGAYDVVVGSRRAIYAPQPDLGLIIIDEEHEWTYKQHDQSPRYHARQVAVKLAELTGAVVILGSATPDVDSFYRAQRGEYRLLELPERIVGRGSPPRLPEVDVVDMRRELRTGNRSIFSRSLSKGIGEALAAREQVILFLNRRGTASFVQCRDCGFVMRCKRCEVSLTYHSAEDELVCHLCNYKTRVPDICPNCFSRRIKFLGVGTQKVEEEVHHAFPEATLLRWDRDVTRGRYSHGEILDSFLAHEADILIGTQMIAKGLDLPLVTLVGVINADINLHLPDFRAAERTFQILTQVAGRAGRGPAGGRVVIQTYTPRHYAIAAASRHDYGAFYEREIYYRRQHETPPFSRLASLVYSHTNDASCQKEAERMHRLLEQERDSQGLPGVAFIGPSPAYTRKLRGRYRWQIVVRALDPNAVLEKVPFSQGWIVDIDPVSIV